MSEKIKVPWPIRESIEGEEPPNLPIRTPGEFPPREQVQPRTTLTLTEATAKMQKYLQKGLGIRSVVAPNELPDVEKLNPHQWGVIVRVEPMKQWPFQVRWISGQLAWMGGEALFVIWPTLTLDEARQLLFQPTRQVM